MKTESRYYTLISGAFFALIWSSPAEARFLQVDPIGYDDQVNLYAYVGNDPLNMADPTGTDAIVLIHEDGRVNFILPMNFTGDAASPQNVAAAIQNIQTTWTGNFDGVNVTTTVVQGTSPLDTTAQNTMRITSGDTSFRDSSNGHQGHSFVTGGRDGEVTMKDINGTPISQPNGSATSGTRGMDTFGHEGGHYMGAGDDAGGPGIMGIPAGPSNRPTGDTIRSMMHTQTPSGAGNTVIRCAESDAC